MNIAIGSRYPYTFRMCGDYLNAACDADFSASATDEEIAADCADLGTADLPYAESVSIYRSIAEQLPAWDRMVCHGAAIEYDGTGYFFAAPSGTGKSTHADLWRKYLGGRVRIINGDKPILRLDRPDAAFVCGTPWAGKEGWQSNRSAPLGAVCLLRRGTENRIEKVTPGAYLAEIFGQVYLPRSTAALDKTLQLLDRLLRTVPLYVLYCDVSEAAVRTSFEALTGEPWASQ